MEAPDAPSSACSNGSAHIFAADPRVRLGVAFSHEVARLPALDERRQASHRGCHHRSAASGSFQGDEPDALLNVKAPGKNLPPGSTSREAHAAAVPQIAPDRRDRTPRPSHATSNLRVAPRAARTTDHDEQGARYGHRGGAPTPRGRRSAPFKGWIRPTKEEEGPRREGPARRLRGVVPG